MKEHLVTVLNARPKLKIDQDRSEKIQDQKKQLLEQVESIKWLFEDDDPENWTEEQKENFNYLSNKLKQELEQEIKDNQQLQTTIKGNPSNPTGEEGKKMIERMNNSHKELTNWGFDFVKDQNPQNILDIGCGGGAAIANLLKRYPEAKVDGIDISEVSVEKSTEFNQQAVEEGRVQVVQGDVLDLPYKADSFDLVVSIESYFFWPDFLKALDQIKKVLRPNGTLLLIAEMYKGIQLSPVEELMRDKFAQKLYSVDEFKNFLSEAGFQDIQIHTKENTSWICVQSKK